MPLEPPLLDVTASGLSHELEYSVHGASLARFPKL